MGFLYQRYYWEAAGKIFRFYRSSYYSRGSLFETKTWLTKAYNRNLISDENFGIFIQNIDNIGIKLNNYIKTIGQQQQYDNDNE